MSASSRCSSAAHSSRLRSVDLLPNSSCPLPAPSAPLHLGTSPSSPSPPPHCCKCRTSPPHCSLSPHTPGPLPRSPAPSPLRSESLTSAGGQEAFRFYYGTIRNFLNFLTAQYPQVQSLQQLRRDPHILDWFTSLHSHQPPLATITYTIHLFHLRRMLEELAW